MHFRYKGVAAILSLIAVRRTNNDCVTQKQAARAHLRAHAQRAKLIEQTDSIVSVNAKMDLQNNAIVLVFYISRVFV